MMEERADYFRLREFSFDGEAVDGGAPDPFDRFSFGLSYKRAKRGIGAWGLTGPEIPNAYTNPKSPKTGSGDWNAEVCDSDNDAFRHVLSCVVNEVVHEALEWLRLDGEILLDPHGPHKARIFGATQACIDRLLPLALDAYEKRGTPSNSNTAP